MPDTLRLPDELGSQLRRRREALRMSKSQLAATAGKVREVIQNFARLRPLGAASLQQRLI